MKSRIAMVFCLTVGGVSLLYAHDLFLKLDSYFLHPDTPVRISVLNGTQVPKARSSPVGSPISA